VDRTFTDSASGRSTARPQLEAMLAFVRDGDTVLVHSMNHLHLGRPRDHTRRSPQPGCVVGAFPARSAPELVGDEVAGLR